MNLRYVENIGDCLLTKVPAIVLILLLFTVSAFGQRGFSFKDQPWMAKANPVSGTAPFVFITSTNASAASTATATTGDINTSGATLIVISANCYDTTAMVVSDSKGNSWTGLTGGGSPSNDGYSNRLFYCLNPTVGTGHNFSLTADYVVLNVVAFSGGTPSFDAQSGAGIHVGGTTTLQPGNITPAGNNELFITGVVHSTPLGTVSIDSSFTIANQKCEGTDAICAGVAYKIQTSGGAENPTWTTPASLYVGASMAAFK